jgi:hypothetical protein
MKRGRKSSGNMLTLVILVMGVIIAIAVIGFVFNSFLFQRARAQYDVDALAVALANKINIRDRVGQMNELQERSRELVHTSRQRTDNCSDEMEFLFPVCDQLLQESREGQALVEAERQNQINLITKELREGALAFNSGKETNNPFSLRWLQTSQPKVRRMMLGRIDNVQSNVKNPGVLIELASFDREHGYIDERTNLFKSNTDAKLPTPDSDLHYKFSPLPAYINNTCAPGRNANPEVFKPYGCVIANGKQIPSEIEYIPNAIQLTCSMDVAFGSEGANKTEVELYSTGTTNGAFAEAE